MEDYTHKYKGEQVEVALFGGEYQEGVLTAYCYVDDVAHIELNGHILVPLQNIASLHCTSRCDAPADHWPPRGLTEDEPATTSSRGMGGALPVVGNLLKALLLFGALCAIFCGLGWALGGYRLILLFGAAAVLIAAAVYGYGDRFVLGMLGARELQLAQAPGLHSTVGRLAARAGVPMPKLQLIPDGHPRAFSVGRGPGGATIAVSSGLVAALPPAELEGVVAHELAHIRSRDVLTQQTAVVLASTLIELLASAASSSARCSSSSARSRRPSCTSCCRRSGSSRPTALAAWLCESPHGLADALIRLEQAVELVDFSASPATEPLYTINPFLDEGLAALFVTHPRPAERVQRLRELDPMWRDKLRAA